MDLDVIATVASIAKFFFGRQSGDSLGLPNDLPADLRKRVHTLHQNGDPVGAAQTLYDAKAFEAAAKLFLAAQMHERAAEAYEQAGLLSQASDIYRQLGMTARVAELSTRQGNHRAAAEHLLSIGQDLQAAESFSRAGDHQRAAEIFIRNQKFNRAAKSFEDAGLTDKQMDMLERQFKADFAAAQGNLQSIQASRYLARIAGEYFLKSNQAQRGINLLLQAGFTEEAAVLLHQSGFTLEAAALLEKLNRFQDAAEYYRLAQQPRRATQMLAHDAISRGDNQAAARLFSEAQDYEQAAKLLMDLDQSTAAAEMFLRAKLYDQAARLFQRAGQLEKAARCFEAARDFPTAADLYTQLGDPSGELRCALALGNMFRVAKLYISLERLEEALQAAERIPFDHPEYAESVELRADILSHLKRFDVAYRTYQEAYKLRSTDPASSFMLLFKQARCLEMLNQTAAAIQLYEQILRLNPTFSKASARLERLRPEPPAAATAVAAHPPQASPSGANAGRRSIMGVPAVPGLALNQPNPTAASMSPPSTATSPSPGMVSSASAAPPPPSRRSTINAPAVVLSNSTPGSKPQQPASLSPSPQQASFIQTQRATSAVLKHPIRRTGTSQRIPSDRSPNPAMSPPPGQNQDSPPPRTYSNPPPQQHSARPSQPLSPPAHTPTQNPEQSFLRTPSALARNPEAFNPSERPRYEIIEEIARGGMGVVFKARDTVLNRVVAYKILSESLKNNEQAVEYFIREARASAKLNHTSIVTTFDAGYQQGEYYMAMEYINGRTLKDYVARQGPFPEKLVRFLLLHACRGLQYAHDAGIIHRDIKGGNMMLTNETKQLKIMDFGLAKVMSEVQKYSNENTRAVGTPFYMSPEQIMGDELDCRSDIYSLGVTFFELATGTVPFFKGDVTYHHVHTPPPSPRSLNPAISEQVEAIILQAMAKRPQDRFVNCNEMIKALK